VAKSKSAFGWFFKFNPKNFKDVFIRVQLLLWLFLAFVALFFVGVNYGMLGPMPDLEAIQNPNSAVPVVPMHRGRLYRTLYGL